MKVIKEKKSLKNKNDSMDIEDSIEKLKVKSRIPDFTGLTIPKSLKYSSQSPSSSQSLTKDVGLSRDSEALNKSSPKFRDISKKSSIPVLRRSEIREYEDINPRNEARRSHIPLQRSTRGSADDLRPPSTPTRIFSNNNSNIINNNYQLEKESSPSLIPKLLLLQKNKRAKFNIEKVNMDVEDFASGEDKNKLDVVVSKDKDQEEEQEEEEEGSKDVKTIVEDDKDDEESAGRRLSSHLSPEASPLSTRSSSRYSPRESESEPTPGLPRKIVAERSESLSSQRIRDAISRTRRESNSSARDRVRDSEATSAGEDDPPRVSDTRSDSAVKFGNVSSQGRTILRRRRQFDSQGSRRRGRSYARSYSTEDISFQIARQSLLRSGSGDSPRIPDYRRLVFISSDSSSGRDEEDDADSSCSGSSYLTGGIPPGTARNTSSHSQSLEDCDWDYFESNSLPSLPSALCSDASGHPINDIKDANVWDCCLGRRLPYPVPVPASLWNNGDFAAAAASSMITASKSDNLKLKNVGPWFSWHPKFISQSEIHRSFYCDPKIMDSGSFNTADSIFTFRPDGSLVGHYESIYHGAHLKFDEPTLNLKDPPKEDNEKSSVQSNNEDTNLEINCNGSDHEISNQVPLDDNNSPSIPDNNNEDDDEDEENSSSCADSSDFDDEEKSHRFSRVFVVNNDDDDDDDEDDENKEEESLLPSYQESADQNGVILKTINSNLENIPVAPSSDSKSTKSVSNNDISYSADSADNLDTITLKSIRNINPEILTADSKSDNVINNNNNNNNNNNDNNVISESIVPDSLEVCKSDKSALEKNAKEWVSYKKNKRIVSDDTLSESMLERQVKAVSEVSELLVGENEVDGSETTGGEPEPVCRGTPLESVELGFPSKIKNYDNKYSNKYKSLVMITSNAYQPVSVITSDTTTLLQPDDSSKTQCDPQQQSSGLAGYYHLALEALETPQRAASGPRRPLMVKRRSDHPTEITDSSELSADFNNFEKTADFNNFEKTPDFNNSKKSANFSNFEKTADFDNFEKSADFNNLKKSANLNNFEKTADFDNFKKSADFNNSKKSADFDRSADFNNFEKSADLNNFEKTADFNYFEKSPDLNNSKKSADFNNFEKTADINSRECSVQKSDSLKLSPTQVDVILEEGLADDDSWVEEVSHDEDEQSTPTTNTEDSSEDEVNHLSGDREEELRGYHRQAIDFTLHTIVEESCEESEAEFSLTWKSKRPPSTSELEKYFFFGLGGVESRPENPDSELENLNNDDLKCLSADTLSREIDSLSETSSVYSEGLESLKDPGINSDSANDNSSRLEKYFLSEFLGFREDRRDSDGSVGSDSEGRPSPEAQRRKRLVRARGTGRSHSSSLDNLLALTQNSGSQNLTSQNSLQDLTNQDSPDESDDSTVPDEDVAGFVEGVDTVKRKKKKRNLGNHAEGSSSNKSPELEEDKDVEAAQVTSEEERSKTPQAEAPDEDDRKQSRDSGFVGSCDDLIQPEPVDNSTPELKNSDENVDDKKEFVAIPINHSLSRKDSFNNWSSDEETNLMMSKMRQFFKTMVANSNSAAAPVVVQQAQELPRGKRTKPPQLVYFENELTRSDLEGAASRSTLQEQISASCQQIISNFDMNSETADQEPNKPTNIKDTAFVYQKLVQSFTKIAGDSSDASSTPYSSPPLIAKVMHHIGSRLVALMHQVSENNSPSNSWRRYPQHTRTPSSASTTEDESTSESAQQTPTFSHLQLPRSKSHDPLLLINSHQVTGAESEEREEKETSDYERFSWRGSFESALMAADSRNKLSLISSGDIGATANVLAMAAKRRSAGDLLFNPKSFSREQLDRVRSCGSIGASNTITTTSSVGQGSVEEKIWSNRRRSSVPDDPRHRRRKSAAEKDQEDNDSEFEFNESRAMTLPRGLQTPTSTSTTNSLPRLPAITSAMHKAHSMRAPVPDEDTLSEACSTPIIGGAKRFEPRSRLQDLNRASLSSLGARSDSMASVYSGAGEGKWCGSVAVRGEVEFSLQYDYKQLTFQVMISQCKDLAPVDVKRNRSDPYVKVYLLPDKSKGGKRKTKVKKHTLNPVFDETLKFNINLNSLENRILWLTVWHSDMFGRNDFLGEVRMPLENKIFDDPTPKWYHLQERSEAFDDPVERYKGEVIVGLKFVPPELCQLENREREGVTIVGEPRKGKKNWSRGSLHVLVKEARNLQTKTKNSGTCDPFCKSYLLPDKGRAGKQKTSVVRKSDGNPVWGHTFIYKDHYLMH
ncbi:Similar to Sytl5: Synaptotagmin-like protein 5 (Mus musculus) [Cotesia congregata]|uniref:Similar to Sytl5: Synaptotagmin-like protein 5 (Mus musculus) n=1 Tax=Cotesia congregata TaxID=51543 RepID=A0A8J2EKN0_COTCN|nr:Similar to Sytl5: Synaptotagmin-like protein 5 (Mus musculus) [Cotesia congregata]